MRLFIVLVYCIFLVFELIFECVFFINSFVIFVEDNVIIVLLVFWDKVFGYCLVMLICLYVRYLKMMEYC